MYKLDKTNKLESWDSWSEYVDYVEHTPRQPGAGKYSETVPPDSWTLDADWDTTLKLAHTGWSDGLQELDGYRDSLFRKLTRGVSTRAVYRNRVVGSMVNIPAYIAGHPAAMRARVHVEAISNKVVKIVANTTVSASVSSSTIVRRGAALCALIDLLERSGRRCEVVNVFATNNKYSMHITLKRAGEPLQLDQIAFALMHPAALRCLYFKAVECSAIQHKLSARGTYGTPSEVPKQYRGDVYLGCGLYDDTAVMDWNSAPRVEEWIRNMLAKQGVTFND